MISYKNNRRKRLTYPSFISRLLRSYQVLNVSTLLTTPSDSSSVDGEFDYDPDNDHSQDLSQNHSVVDFSEVLNEIKDLKGFMTQKFDAQDLQFQKLNRRFDAQEAQIQENEAISSEMGRPWLPTAATVQKAQRSIGNFKSASTVLVETVSGGSILPISDVHWTPPFSGFYKLNVDATYPIEGDKWGIGVAVRDNEDSKVAEALAMRKGLEFATDMSFLNLIAESAASNVVLALNVHLQSPNYVGSII
ncbi:hypothetical protein MTR_8g051775 [Medicago truncatula]|uniref:RNase H type-1 domain-containing protein n=1 Tax=Medicago truncatula TaxID=3880 RepID=A0A072TPS3_MEDTR|nr:hypothetical protein MTR_8g051775 [Medicago truncatula]